MWKQDVEMGTQLSPRLSVQVELLKAASKLDQHRACGIRCPWRWELGKMACSVRVLGKLPFEKASEDRCLQQLSCREVEEFVTGLRNWKVS